MAPFWKSAALLFVALRFGDMVNAVIGIWLVPKYVDADQLGAVMPLVQASALLATPIAVLVAPYSRLLAVHAAKGELGEAKGMVRDATLLAVAATLLSMAVAPFALPPLFSRFGIENGRLALAIVASSAVGALAPVFSETIRALGSFGAVSLANAAAPVVRLAAMLVALPIRGLTGYFAGQAAGPAFVSAFSLGMFVRRVRGVRVKAYWSADRRQFLSFLFPFAVFSAVAAVRGMAEMVPMSFIPREQSAAYYQISRFSEIAAYFGVTVSYLLFPVVAARQARGTGSTDILARSMAFAVFGGLAVSAFVAAVAPVLFSAVSFLAPYRRFVCYMFPFGAIASLRVAESCFVAHETARGDFRFLRWELPVQLAAIAALALVCRGPSAFRLGPWSLGYVAVAMAIPAFTLFCFAAATVFGRVRRGVA